MKPTGRPARNPHPESIEFVPKRELDRAQQENDRLRKEIERLKQETERLRRELEAALRATKRLVMRQMAREFSTLGVTEIARTVCELLNWTRPNGGLKNHECRQLLMVCVPLPST
jgi:hypothetical protein